MRLWVVVISALRATDPRSEGNVLTGPVTVPAN